MSEQITVAYAVEELQKLFDRSSVDDGHGLKHAIDVMSRVKRALEVYPFKQLKKEVILAVKLSALLHDADDHKFFPHSNDYDNARAILQAYSPEVSTLALKMIRLVSCSVNGNSTDSLNLPEEEWMLYPRWADRLTALGKLGIYRCWVYSCTVRRPLYTEQTPRVTDLDQLKAVAPPERFQHYIEVKGKVGLSTMIDHFYDKLIHLAVETANPYFQEQFEKEMAPIYEFLFEFGRTGQIAPSYLDRLKAEFDSNG